MFLYFSTMLTGISIYYFTPKYEEVHYNFNNRLLTNSLNTEILSREASKGNIALITKVINLNNFRFWNSTTGLFSSKKGVSYGKGLQLFCTDGETELITILDELKSKKALSMEIVRIAKTFFLGNNGYLNNQLISKELLKLAEAEKIAKEALEKAQEAIAKLEELRPVIESKAEKEKEIEEIPLIEELRNDVFRDVLEEEYEIFASRARKLGRRPEDMIKTRLNSWASEKQIPFPKAVELFLRAFPDLKGLFEVEVRV